eukprot:TRINITY_DN61607_c0_g1_i1.p1 TRINITY_DN61607_c0_g1~~TRINITY_DN61607_c0_g1_i1.p1  ORF type:complete len:354 (+),score=45.43 TRINITY_DN61607_c0_g1_i1:69-1064(+)
MTSLLQAAVDVFGSGLEMIQAEAHQEEQSFWAQKQYRLDVFSFTIDILDKTKDEVRDLYDCYSGRIDTLMVLHTLLLTLGFAVMGYNDTMFPRNTIMEGQNLALRKIWLVFFATVQATGMIMPLWAIACLVKCRQRLESWLDESLRKLHKQLTCKMTEREALQAETHTDVKRLDEMREKNLTGVVALLSSCHEEFDEMWQESCQGPYRVASWLLWCNVILAVADAGIQMGVFLKRNYTIRFDEDCLGADGHLHEGELCLDAPVVWISYISILVVGSIIVMFPSVFNICRGSRTLPSTVPAVELRPQARTLPTQLTQPLRPTGRGIPVDSVD